MRLRGGAGPDGRGEREEAGVASQGGNRLTMSAEDTNGGPGFAIDDVEALSWKLEWKRFPRIAGLPRKAWA